MVCNGYTNIFCDFFRNYEKVINSIQFQSQNHIYGNNVTSYYDNNSFLNIFCDFCDKF